MTKSLKREDFTELSPASLNLDHFGSRLSMSVLETRELPPTSPRTAPFAVVLGGPPSPVLAQGIYLLDHPVCGRLELFMVPIGRDANATRYEIIFN